MIINKHPFSHFFQSFSFFLFHCLLAVHLEDLIHCTVTFITLIFLFYSHIFSPPTTNFSSPTCILTSYSSPVIFFSKPFHKAALPSMMAVAPHSPSAVQEALSLPEIFAMILEAEECSGDKNYLVPILDVRDLRNAMRVNRLWFEIAAEKIWADWGSIDWLFQVPPNCRQIYASKIAQVSITGLKPVIYHRQYKGLVFRRLRNISLEVYGKYELRHLEPYLVPSLQSFSLPMSPNLIPRCSPACREKLRTYEKFQYRQQDLTPHMIHFVDSYDTLHISNR